MKRSGGFSPPTQPSKKQNTQESFIGSMFGIGFASAAKQGMRFCHYLCSFVKIIGSNLMSRDEFINGIVGVS